MTTPRPGRLASTLFILATACSCQTSQESGPLDGQVYTVQLRAADGQAAPDDLIFDNGSFESTACRSYGFTRSCYTATADGAATNFEVSCTNSAGACNDWSGSVHGSRVSGTLRNTMPDGKVTEYRYEGRKASGMLDGKSFHVTLAGAKDQPPLPDDLVFTDGLFESTACRGFGFARTSYSASMEGDAMRFLASATSATDGATEWNGVVRGNRVEGSMRWTNASGQVSEYHFTGTIAG